MQNYRSICSVITTLLITCFAQGLVSSTTTVPRSNSEICSGPDAENEVLCGATAMGASESAPTSPSIEQVANDVQNLQISSTSCTSSTSSYSGNVQNVLGQVLGKLKLKEDAIKTTNEKLDVLVKQKLIEGLKEQCPLFKMLFREIVWTGSYYEGLKISKPDEFDLNVVLRLPVSDNQVEIEARSDLPGYVTVKNFGEAIRTLNDNPIWKPVYSKLLKWAEPETGNLLQSQVFRWMEGTMFKFVEVYNKNNPKQQLKLRKSGPALTLWIEDHWSVDVVPVFGFTFAPPKPIKTPRPLNRQWMIVPKPLGQGKDATDVVDAWRVNFYQYEMEILRGYGNIKPAIKLVKKLRDNLDFKNLYSYAIKTIAIWMKEKGELSENDPVELAFIKLLKKIKKYIEVGILPFYWEESCNMLKMTHIVRQNMARRLDKLIGKIEDDWVENPAAIGDLIMPENAQAAAGRQQDNCAVS